MSGGSALRSIFFLILKCTPCRDLPTLQFWSKSDYPSWSSCPFFIKFKKKVKFKLQKIAACQDLPTLQFWSKSHYPFWSSCPFFIKMFSILILSSYISKTLEIEGKFKLQKCSACQDLQKKFPIVKNVRQLCQGLFLLKCIFFGYSNNQKEATLLQNVK